MHSKHLSSVIGACAVLSTASCVYDDRSAAADPVSSETAYADITMGDGQINGDLITPYDFTWTQCSFQDGAWVNGPPHRETLTLRPDGDFELSQFSPGPDGGQTTITHVLERQTLRRTQLTQTVTGPDGGASRNARLLFSDEGYAVQVGDETRQGGNISSEMYAGAFLGLPLSTLDMSKGPYRLDAGMLAVQGTYRVRATLAGGETLSLENGPVETQLVDVWWLHNESGDIYAPGPDGSGGRYWILASPNDQLPRVLAYKTDTYAIEYAPMTCPSE